METKKAQSAIEFLTIYSWAILVIAIFVAAVLLLSLSPSSQPFVSTQCTIQPLLPCQDTILTTPPITYYMTFVNNLQSPMNFTTNAITLSTTGIGTTGTQTSTGSCWPGFALPGTEVVCQVRVSGNFGATFGTQANTYFTLSYYLCNGRTQSTCNTGSAYKSTGYSVQTIDSTAPTYNSMLFEVNGQGAIVVGGQTYTGTSNVLLMHGNYVIYGQPANGWTLQTFNVVSGTSSKVTPLAPANGIATLSVVTNGVITANFIPTNAIFAFYFGGSGSGGSNAIFYGVLSPVAAGPFSFTGNYPYLPGSPSSVEPGCATYQNYVYCIGGVGSAANVYSVSISKNGVGAWTAQPNNYPSAGGAGDAPCVAYNSYLYCIPYDGSNFYAAPISGGSVGSWVQTNAQISGLISPGPNACAQYNGYLYCVDGDDGVSGGVYYTALSPSGLSWTTISSSYPVSAIATPTCVAANGYMYCIGGSSSGSAINSIYSTALSNPGIGSWTSITNTIPISATYLVMQGCTTAAISGQIYCLAASSAGPSGIYNASILPNGGLGAWTSLGSGSTNYAAWGGFFTGG